MEQAHIHGGNSRKRGRLSICCVLLWFVACARPGMQPFVISTVITPAAMMTIRGPRLQFWTEC